MELVVDPVVPVAVCAFDGFVVPAPSDAVSDRLVLVDDLDVLAVEALPDPVDELPLREDPVVPDREDLDELDPDRELDDPVLDDREVDPDAREEPVEDREEELDDAELRDPVDRPPAPEELLVVD